MKYYYLDGFPVFYTNRTSYFQLRDFRIFKFEDGKEVGDWQTLTDDTDPKVREWMKVFWNDLIGAPQYEVRANQWVSEYVSLMDNRVFSWCDDRHENCYMLHGSSEPSRFITDPYNPEAVKDWLKGLL